MNSLKKHCLLVFIALLLAGANGCAPKEATDSSINPKSMMNVNPGHTSQFIIGESSNDGTPDWTVDLSGKYYKNPSIAVSVDKVFINGPSMMLNVLEQETGKKVWLYNTRNSVTPAITDKSVFITGSDNNLHALDINDGHEQWQFDRGLNNSIDIGGSSPAVKDGFVYIGTSDGISVLDAVTGEEVRSYDPTNWWENLNPYHGEKFMGSSPALEDGLVFFTSYIYNDDHVSGGLYAIEELTGEQKWSRVLESATDVIVTDGIVFVGQRFGNIQMFDAKTGETLPNLPCHGQPLPAIAHGTAFCVNGQNIEAVNVASAKTLWKFVAVREIQSSPVIAGESVYFGDGANKTPESGSLYSLDAVSGNLNWQRQLGNQITSSPAAINGMIFTTSGEGIVSAFE